MATHIFYHRSDLDGKCSGAIAYRYEKNLGIEPILHPINYGDAFPWDAITPEDTVYMLDFSLQPYEDMQRLHTLVGDRLIWCDHHKTALESVRALYSVPTGADIPIPGLRRKLQSGCELTWNFLHHTGTESHSMPLSVYLLGRYDVWDHDANRQLLPFQYGCRILNLSPDSTEWDTLLNDIGISDILRNGSAILAYIKDDRRRAVRSGAFLHRILDHSALCCNAAGGSKLFDDAPEELLVQADLLLTFGYNGRMGKWVFGLYHKPGREDIDCGAIAKHFGGGGHRGAAGFHLPTISEFFAQII